MPSLRERLAGLLKEKRYDSVLEEVRRRRGALRTLAGLLYSEDELVIWRAVTMFGRLAKVEPDIVRPVIARLLWFLNEESSTVGWGAAQAIGEIAVSNPGLARDAARIVAIEFIAGQGPIEGTGP